MALAAARTRKLCQIAYEGTAEEELLVLGDLYIESDEAGPIVKLYLAGKVEVMSLFFAFPKRASHTESFA